MSHLPRVTNRVIFFGICLFLIVGISFTVGMFNLNDSYSYVTLGRYFYTGQVVPIQPYNMVKPQTLFGPLYGLIIAPFFQLYWPSAIYVVPLLQVVSVFLSAAMLFVILKKYLPKPWPTVGAIAFLLLPFNLLYATFVLSETLTQFLFAMYVFVLFVGTQKKSSAIAGSLVFIASLMTITRYAYAILLIPTLIVWLYVLAYGFIKKKHRPLLFIHHILAVCGIGIIIFWMHFNWQLNGVWQISSYTGRHLWDNVVAMGKFLPPLTDPSMQPFQKSLGDDLSPMFKPWWDAQQIFNDHITPETTVDKRMLAVSIAAIIHNPIAYTFSVLGLAARTPTITPDYPPDMVSELRACRKTWCYSCQNTPWNACWVYSLCPTVRVCQVQSLWADWAQVNISMYPYIPLVIFLIVATGIIQALRRRDIFLTLTAGIFITIHLFQSATEWFEGRFIIPLYPAYAIFFTMGCYTIFRFVRRRIASKRSAGELF